jgi:hypothetical protein
MRIPPILTVDDGDVAAEAEAAQARRHASEVVRNHLETHSFLNPGASSDYISWIATLHPENAEITIDQRFFVPGNPWWTIYEDTKYYGGGISPPTAMAVPVNEDSSSNNNNKTSGIGCDVEHGQGRPSSSSSSPAKTKGAYGYTNAPPFYLVCSPLSIFVGVLVGFHAILGTFLCEFLALLLCHYPAAFFYNIANSCSPPGACTLLPHSLCMLLYSCLALADSLVLLTSVMVVELMATVGYVVQLLTGGILMAKFWHQYIRRSCHGFRVMFRQCSSTNPSRHFVFSCCTPNQQTMDQQNLTADAIAATEADFSVAVNNSNNNNSVTVVEHVTARPILSPFKE